MQKKTSILKLLLFADIDENMKNKYFSIGYSDAANNRYTKVQKLSPTLAQCHKGNEGVRAKWHNYKLHWSDYIVR